MTDFQTFRAPAGGQREDATMSTGEETGRVSALKRFWRDRKGVAALEFALIAPLLLCMYFITMEVAQGIETDKKIGRVGSMVADLVTQQQQVTKADIDAIMAIGEATIQPYGRSKPSIEVTAIQITDETTPKVKVVWSRKLVNGVFSVASAKDSITTVPTALKVKGSFLIRVQSSLAYKPVVTWAAENKQPLGLVAAFDGINMREIYHLRPRMSTTVPCTDC